METGKYGMKEHCSGNFNAPSVGFIYMLPVDLVSFKFLLILVIMFIVTVRKVALALNAESCVVQDCVDLLLNFGH